MSFLGESQVPKGRVTKGNVCFWKGVPLFFNKAGKAVTDSLAERNSAAELRFKIIVYDLCLRLVFEINNIDCQILNLIANANSKWNF